MKLSRDQKRKLRDFLAKYGIVGDASHANGQYQVGYRKTTFTAPNGVEETHFPPANALDRPATRMVLEGKYHEPETHNIVEWLFKRRPGDMISAGTFFGDMLPSWSAKCPGTVYAFEPVTDSYVLARLCQMENDLDNVILFNAALSGEIGSARIRTERPRDGKSTGGGARIHKKGDQIITTMSMDSLNLQDLSVMQLDLEGHEKVAMPGARETILRCKPVILLEDTRQQCYEIMTEMMGYVLVGELPGIYVWVHPDEADELRAYVEAHNDGYKRPQRQATNRVRDYYPGSNDEETEKAKLAAGVKRQRN